MLARLKSWFKDKESTDDSILTTPVNRSGRDGIARRSTKPNKSATATKSVDFPDADRKARPRSKYIREQTGNHETLKILDSSLLETEEENGIDPYNTGGFDRSKNWNSSFRK